MISLGFSGLPQSIDYKRRHFADARVHRIVQGLDSAAALVRDGNIVAAVAEERFNRDKGTNAFPKEAISFCLHRAGISFDAIECIAHCFSYEPYRDFYAESTEGESYFNSVLRARGLYDCFDSFYSTHDIESRFLSVPHHLAHAASAFYPSGFEEALIVVADGMGESDSLSVGTGVAREISILRRYSSLHSLGILYGVLTLYLGFEMNRDEYKVMGLASYGDRNVLRRQCQECVTFLENGGFRLPLMLEDRTAFERDTHSGVLSALERMFGPQRPPRSEITKHHMNIAAAFQELIEEVLSHVLRFYVRETAMNSLVLAGGVALNCVANGAIRQQKLFKKLFIQPAAGDDGAALGAALYANAIRSSDSPIRAWHLPFWGPEYSDDEVRKDLNKFPNLEIDEQLSDDDLIRHVVERLIQGQIIAWFQGRSEFGPRALGNRSILADPRVADIKQRLNVAIKEREDFRPFAPAVTSEAASKYFDVENEEYEQLSSMLFTVPVVPMYQRQLPAITHVDGSARVQMVSRRDHPLFWSLLNYFGERTGTPVLLNTSFNIDEPIVNSPQQALMTFSRSKIDALAIGRFVVTRLSDGEKNQI